MGFVDTYPNDLYHRSRTPDMVAFVTNRSFSMASFAERYALFHGFGTCASLLRMDLYISIHYNFKSDDLDPKSISYNLHSKSKLWKLSKSVEQFTYQYTLSF